MLRINPRFRAVSIDALNALRSIDTLLFGLQLADLDTYHYQRRYQLWICKLMILGDAVYKALLSEKRGQIAWYSIYLFIYFFHNQNMSAVRLGITV